MIDENEIQRVSFDLNDTQPIEVIIRTNEAIKDNYFDMHYALEVGVLIKGRMKREYFDHQIEIGPGDVWFCGMWEPHGFELLERPCEAVVFVINPKYLAHSQFLNYNAILPFQVIPSLRPKGNEQNKLQLIELAEKVKKGITAKKQSDWMKIHFFELLLILLETWKKPKTPTGFQLDESIHNALKLMFNKKKLISTSEAAMVCNMSTTKFRVAFKKLMRCSFSDFALKYRVHGALSQLKNSNETQEAVALHWGFTDASHLHKCLKKYEL